MTIETEIVTRLEDDAGVGAEAGNRIYPILLPQRPIYPAIVYRRISGPRLHHLTGSSGRGVARIQIDCWAKTYVAAQALAAAVRASLDGFTGKLTTLDATCKLDNEIDDYDDEAKVYRVIQDYLINHTE